MRSLSAGAIAAISGPRLAIIQLVYLGFPGIPIALNSSNRDVVYGGVTYRGAAGLGSISPINDSPGEVKGLQFSISGVPTENIALALADATIVQGAAVTIRLAILNDAGDVADAPADWVGRMDTMSVEENGDTCTISATSESTAVDLLRGNSLTTSNADQQYLFPGDRAFEYVASQANQPVVWPTKQLFIAMR